MYQIPLFDLNYDQTEEQAVIDVLRSKWISAGPKCAEMENRFCEAFGAPYALGLSNCTDALHLALLALDIGPGDEVIVPSLTFVATANSVRYTGATPVFCDIESLDRPVLDPVQLETLVTPRTRAITVMHYGGFACNMESILSVAQKHGLRVVEDACHGPLSEYQGKKLGTLGDIGCFSFFSNKNISTGEGGLVTTNDEALYQKMKLLRSHGMTSMSFERASGHSTRYDVVALGYNYRIDDIRSALAIAQLDKLPADIERRRVLRARYLEKLNPDTLLVPFRNNDAYVSNYIFPVVVKGVTEERRDEIRDALQEKGIQTSIHYPPAHRFSIYQAFTRPLPLTEAFFQSEITLPLYGSLTMDQVDYIADTLNGAVEGK